MNLRPIPSKNACIIRKDFVQESQHFIIRKTPYYINVPGEITFLPRNKGFFPRLLIKIMRVFQQNCRKKYHPEPEFLEFPQKTPESNLDYQSITNEKKEKTSPLDEVFFTQNQMKDSSEEIIKKNNDSFGSLLPGQSIKNSTKAHDKSEEEGEKIEPSNKRLEKNEEQNRFLNYNASSNRILEKKETFRKPIVEKNRKWMRKAKDILSQKQKLYEQKSKFNANMYKVQEDNGYENRINHGKRKRKV